MLNIGYFDRFVEFIAFIAEYSVLVQNTELSMMITEY